ncbi:dynamin family protein [Gulosibacter bifidus]|uniref:Dynamin family protein n=1 Tax=Gulosibacter bifidus TaxID=272239 RepID=A0ABW5RIA3_9MICO|nr:dynamin family protein [Gulosibacter bifidus]
MTSTETAKTAPRKDNSATAAFRALAVAAKEQNLGTEFSAIARMVKQSSGVPASVVVVGEMNRGKSTLINALLAAPGLAPTAPTETTALSVAYRPATESFPAGTAELEFASEPRLRRIPAHELMQWVHIDSPVLQNAEEMPLQATFGVRPAYVPRAVLVDTPGSGGLSEAYAMRAVSRAQSASVLLLVTDASGRITRPALEFLVRCSATVDSVVLAVSKIDLYRAGWQQIVEENRQILAAREPRLGNIPIIGVSGTWGERAAREEDPARRERLLQMSGIPALAEALNTPLRFANQLPTLNALRRGSEILREPLIALESEREALGGIVEDVRDLERVKQHREQLLRTFEDAKYDWSAKVDRVRVDLTAANARLAREFGAHWRERAQSYGSGLSARQSMALQNELAADMEVQIRRGLNGMVHQSGRLLGDLYAAAGMNPQRNLLAEVQRRAAQTGASQNDLIRREAASLDPRTLLSGTIMGSGIGSLALGAVLGPLAAPLLGMAVMGSFGAVLAHRQAKRQSVLQTIGDATIELREVLDRGVRSILGVVSTDAKKLFDRDLRQSANRAKEELGKLETARRASEAERKGRIAKLDPQIARLRQAIDAAEAECARIAEKGRSA